MKRQKENGSIDQEGKKGTKTNVKIFYKAREKVIKLFDDYIAIASKAKTGGKYEKRIKILTPKAIHLKVYQMESIRS